MKRKITLLVLLMWLGVAGIVNAAGQPTEQLQATIDEVVAILTDKSMAGQQHVEERRARLRSAIADGFDFQEMSRRVLGSKWNQISSVQRQQFVQHMTVLLEQAYFGKLESYSGEPVVFVAERIKGSRAQVSTLIRYEGSTLPVHYIMYSDHGRWLVYDINIEGVSLVRNYLEQFRAMMRNHSFDDLLQILKAKNLANAEKRGMA